MLQTVATVAGVAILLAILWAAREALMLVYVSALIAMGFSPLVKLIEHQHPNASKRRVPRWLAILVIYIAIVAVIVLLGLMVIPPLVAQAGALWDEIPDGFNRLQSFLIRYKLMTRRITLAEAVSSAPSGSGGNAVGTVLVAISSLIGGIFGLITILILTFYLLIEAGTMFHYLMRFVPLGRRGDVATVARQAVYKVSAWLRAQFILAGVMGTFSAIGLGPDGRAVLLRHRARRGDRRDDSDRRSGDRRHHGGGGRDHRVAEAGADGRRPTSWCCTSSRRTSSCRRSWSAASASARWP